MNGKGIRVVRSRGNVFRDIGFSREEAARLAVRADLLIQLQQPCSIRLLRTPKSAASFYDFDEYERLVEAARTESQTYVAVLLGGERRRSA